MLKGMNWRNILGPHARAFAHDQTGSSAVEFVLVFPLLALMLFGIINFGIAFNNRVALTDGTRVAARELAISRLDNTPHTTATARFNNSTTGLNPAQRTITFLVNNVACTTDAACKTALAAAGGLPVTARASYPCTIDMFGFQLSSCTLRSETTERVE